MMYVGIAGKHCVESHSKALIMEEEKLAWASAWWCKQWLCAGQILE